MKKRRNREKAIARFQAKLDRAPHCRLCGARPTPCRTEVTLPDGTVLEFRLCRRCGAKGMGRVERLLEKRGLLSEDRGPWKTTRIGSRWGR
jgi:hypothetical protein